MRLDGAGSITYTGTGFDYETVQAADGWDVNGTDPTLTLSVTATSDGEQETADVTITLTNANELSFDAAPYSFTLDENVAKDDDIGAVVVSDANSTTRDISYTLFDENKQNENPLGFRIDSGTGVISYSGAGFDFETDSDITLTVVATSDADSTSTPVTIQLVDVPEPAFDPAGYSYAFDWRRMRCPPRPY